MSNWKPLINDSSAEPIIVMCPEGGELHCYKDGLVVQYDGAKMYGFKLPPSARLFFDTDTPLANTDREIVEGKL